MKRMLINATQSEELRVAIVDGQKLINLDIESTGKEQKKSNIYKGVITRIEPSLEAAFVDYGAKRHGFLSVKDVAPNVFIRPAEDSHGRLHIRDVLVEGQEILVQVEKEERGSKGAALTTFISLAGCYLVLVPNNPRAAGISKRVEGDERDDLRSILENLPLPEGMGLIARTASAGRNNAELSWDLQALIERWKTIQQVSKEKRAPLLIHQESGVIIRSIRDHLREDISEILIDDPDIFSKTREYVRSLRPDCVNRVKLYRDTVPLFNRYQIETTIESAFSREVKLPSGGSIVIDRTEALVSIDINSAKATKGGDIEETAVNTNVEAADEIARQLRMRDLAGLIVIDFIDMTMSSHQREVENRLRDALIDDRARVQVGRISRFGLLEMSRQRLGPTLAEAIEDICPTCHGHGTVRGVASLSLVILRAIEEEAIKENTAQVQVQLPIELATYLLNEKRKHVTQIEQRHHVEVVIIPNQYLQRPYYDVTRVRQDEADAQGGNISYKMVRLPGSHGPAEETAVERRAEPLLKDLRGTSGGQRQPSFFKRIISTLFGETKEHVSPTVEPPVADANAQAAPVDRRSGRNDRSRQPRQPRQTRSREGAQGGTSTRSRRQDNAMDTKESIQLSEDARLQQKYLDENAEKAKHSPYTREERTQERGSRTQSERGERGGRNERNPRNRRPVQEPTPVNDENRTGREPSVANHIPPTTAAVTTSATALMGEEKAAPTETVRTYANNIAELLKSEAAEREAALSASAGNVQEGIEKEAIPHSRAEIIEPVVQQQEPFAISKTEPVVSAQYAEPTIKKSEHAVPAHYTEPVVKTPEHAVPAHYTEPVVKTSEHAVPAHYTEPVVKTPEHAVPAHYTEPVVKTPEHAVPAHYTEPVVKTPEHVVPAHYTEPVVKIPEHVVPAQHAEPMVTTTEPVAHAQQGEPILHAQEHVISAQHAQPISESAMTQQVESVPHQVETLSPTAENEAAEDLDSATAAEEATTRYPRRRRPQRPYRGPGRRRHRETQRRPSSEHSEHNPHE